MGKNKQSTTMKILDTIKSYWPLLVVLFGIIGTIVTIPSRLVANEKKTEKLEARQDKTDEYIQAIEEQKKLMMKAPKGFKWDETLEDYVEWPDDPRLKKKK